MGKIGEGATVGKNNDDNTSSEGSKHSQDESSNERNTTSILDILKVASYSGWLSSNDCVVKVGSNNTVSRCFYHPKSIIFIDVFVLNNMMITLLFRML